MAEEYNQSTTRRISNFFLPGNSDKRDTSTLVQDSDGMANTSGRGRTPDKSRIVSANMAIRTSTQGLQEQPPILAPPPRIGAVNGERRSSSQPAVRTESTPTTFTQSPTKLTPTDSNLLGDPAGGRKVKRKSWMPSSGNTLRKDAPRVSPKAWIAGHKDRLPYDIRPLVSGARVNELWDDTGDTYVYLFPRTARRGPSFKIYSSVFSSSSTLTQLAFGGLYSQKRTERRIPAADNSSPPQFYGAELPSTPPMTPKSHPTDNMSSGSSRWTPLNGDPPREVDLYLPISLSADFAFPSSSSNNSNVTEDDLDTLVTARNMFAFLIGQSLISIERRPTIFDIFLKIGDSLKSNNFTNIDGSTFGEVAATSFDHYVDELGIADVRASREKTIEGMVLAEKMRSVLLYNETFVHAVGRYDDILQISRLSGPSTKFSLISPTTRSRLERASIDLLHREKSVNTRLQNFDFPSIFVGVMSSKTLEEPKLVNGGAWREWFNSTRKHVLGYYKNKFGSWPPRASSKRNDFESSGLNRLVLKVLYRDFSMLYDLYVDRTNLTTRSMDIPATSADDQHDPPIPRVLRRVFDEYDRSSPPVQPPVPFDTPLLPSVRSLRKDNSSAESKDSRSVNKKLRDEEVLQALDASINADMASEISKSSFLSAMRTFEKKEGRGGNLMQLIDIRCGIWIFLYVVLQSLPMLVVDAPGIRFREGVEYFLAEPPRGGVPWASAVDGASAARGKKSWYGISSGGGVVSLPSDLIEHGVEGVYRRSHCWTAAMKWSTALQQAASPSVRSSSERQYRESQAPVLPMPPILAEDIGGGSPVITYGRNSSRTPSRQASPAGRMSTRDSVLALGLEALPLPTGVAPGGANDQRKASRPSSATIPEPGKTFDDIINGIEQEKRGRRTSGK